jgi:hypothetical protein
MGDELDIPEHIARSLTATVESIERLDVLLYARAARGKAVAARGVGPALHLSVPMAEQHLAVLCGQGFLTVSIGSDLLYSYQPKSLELDRALEALAKLDRRGRAAFIDTFRDLGRASSLPPPSKAPERASERSLDKKGKRS